MTPPPSIPVIDLAGTFSADIRDRAAAAKKVRAASRELGMFYVTNHGVPTPLVDAHFDLARSFFGLELREKRAIDVSRSNCFRGYEAFGSQTIDAATPGDLKEGFIMGPDLAPDHPHVLARYPNTGTNLWPQRPAGFRRHMEAYVDAMNRLGRRLAGLLALSLELPADYFSVPLSDPLTYSQLLYYPALPAEGRENQLGAGAHVDWGMLTILLQDDVGGLEVYAHETVWQAATPVPDSFVIVLGEMIVRLTDGFYRSAKHRVKKNTSGRGRYAMPTFFDPAYDYRVTCVPTCRPVQGEPYYPPRTVAQHMQEMAHGTLSAQQRPPSARQITER
jgi:isopenicillin N synthase-like dioxygenase